MEGSMERWLEIAGFSDNPFAFHEAGMESRLSDYFVPPACFTDIVGDPASPRPTVVFAGRGCGKTAQRVMAQHFCKENRFRRGRGIGVVYSDFDAIAAIARSQRRLEVLSGHASEILALAVHGLTDALLTDESALNRYCNLPRWERFYIHCFLNHFRRGLSLTQRSRLASAQLDPSMRNGAAMDEVSSDLFRDFREKADTEPAALLPLFSKLLDGLGFDALYVLVDGVDELATFSDHREMGIDIIEPVLAKLSFLETPGIAFKFFLPLEWAEALLSRGALRPDRVQVRFMQWTSPELVEMLRRRLSAFRGGVEMKDLCEPDLGERIESEMTRFCMGSPRNLIRLGNTLFSEHCARFNGTARPRIPLAAWEKAKTRFQKMLDSVPGNGAGRNAPNDMGDPFFPPC